MCLWSGLDLFRFHQTFNLIYILCSHPADFNVHLFFRIYIFFAETSERIFYFKYEQNWQSIDLNLKFECSSLSKLSTCWIEYMALLPAPLFTCSSYANVFTAWSAMNVSVIVLWAVNKRRVTAKSFYEESVLSG